MKKLNKALISTAVLAGLYAGNAFAGTEACFEIYKGAVNANHPTLFASAQCYTGSPEVRDVTLLGLDSGKVAYELTKGAASGYTIDLGDADFAADADKGVQIVYVPTTDIPGASRIKVKLTNAKFGANANQIFLLGNDGAAANLTVLATSDGLVDGQDEIEFLTQSGVTIPAGTRMLFSRVNTVTRATYAEHRPVLLNTTNTTCTESGTKQVISIAATSATTDGGSNIIGGKSRAETLVDISPQFVTFLGSATSGEVNAQSKNAANADIVARTEFVFQNDSLTLRKSDVIAKFGFADRAALLDKSITVDANDKLRVKFQTEGTPGDSVRVGVFNGQASALPGTVGLLSSQINLTSVPAQTGVYANYGVLGSAATVQTYALDGNVVFTAAADANGPEATPAAYAGAVYNDLFFSVSQRDLTKVMGFNYTVDVNHTLDLEATTELDHCNVTTRSHNIGINGAVLKVPYSVSGDGNFVRITNEHNQAAEVTVDVFGESVDGTVGNRSVTAVSLATIPAKSSYVYFVPAIIEAAVAQKNYAGADGAANTPNTGNPLRHTLTFAVTAPKDSVHGVTVQRIIGGVDRVMPVLDQNAWNQ